MIHIVFLFIIFTTSASYAAPNCDAEKPQTMYDFIIKNHKYEDVSYYIDWLKQCDQSKTKLLSETDASDFRQTGLEAEANYLFQTAKAASYYRDSKIELNDYLEFTKENNLKYNQVKNENAVEDIKKRQAEKKFIKPAECSEVNLKNKFPEVRNQDSVGWCYAFVAAYMISYKTGYKVSAIDIAVNFSQKYRISHDKRKIYQGELHKDIEGGWSTEAITEVVKKGICKESDSPSEYFAENKDIGDYIKNAEDPFSKMYSQHSVLNGGSTQPICLSKESPFLKDIFKVLNQSQPNNIMYKLNQQRCHGRRSTIEPEKYAVSEFEGPKEELIKKLHETLNEKKHAAIGYSASFLQDRRAPGHHASIVVGRRYNQEAKSCQFLIRNSWGPNCQSYALPYPVEGNCADGHIWVSEETLHQNIYRVTNFKN